MRLPLRPSAARSPRRLLPCVALLLGALGVAGCGSGSSAKGEPDVAVAVTTATIGGPAAHPDGGALTVTVDGVPATIADGRWSCEVDLASGSGQVSIEIRLGDEVLERKVVSVTR